LINNIDSNLQFFFNEFELPYNKPHTFSRALLFHSFLLNIITTTEISVKYRGYIEREKKLADKILRLENLNIPNDFDYSVLNSISIESRQKLEAIRPKTISQASRIPGVSPADISVLLVYFGR
jgi:tRNA uridine 5-carboxymethylaminomethyl modification enzyme